jgi:hypothetical protein
MGPKLNHIFRCQPAADTSIIPASQARKHCRVVSTARPKTFLVTDAATAGEKHTTHTAKIKNTAAKWKSFYSAPPNKIIVRKVS